jgi:cytochrome c556
VEVGLKGTVERIPTTDEEWAKLRYQAVTLAEASNLILMEGRRVAAPGDKGERASDPNALAPEKIEELIGKDRANWTKFAQAMHQAAMTAIKAVDSRKSEAVSDAGNDINTACEDCHKQYWYPEPPKTEGDSRKN